MSDEPQPRRIEYVSLDDVVPAERNAKLHDDGMVDESIDEHGLVAVMIRDDRTGRLVAGHGRRASLLRRRAAGEPPPEGVYVDADGRWIVPLQVGWASRDDEQAERYVLVDNQATIAGGWDPRGLADILKPKLDAGNLRGSGFDPEAVQALLAKVPDSRGPRPENTDVPNEPPPAVAEHGDVWQLGRHTLMVGDCRSADDVARLLGDTKIDVAFTSPPYADRRKYDETTEFKPVAPDDYVDWFEAVAANVAAHLADRGSWFVNIRAGCDGGQRQLYVLDLVLAHVRRWGWKLVDDFEWVDTANGIPGGWPNRFKDAHEPVYHFGRTTRIKMRPLANGTETDMAFSYSPENGKSATGSGLLGVKVDAGKTGFARPSNVLHMTTSSASEAHPAMFPIDLPEWFIRAFSDDGDTVFDPFCGAGTTLLACEQSGRTGYGMELSPKYADVTLARWQRVTGVQPLRDGVAHDMLEVSETPAL